jgi:hypothetical protein
MYIGFGSEVQKIKDKNPHLDFDIAQVPQLNPNAQMTFGRFYGMVLPANGKQTSSAMGAIIAIMDSDFMSNVVGDGIYAPARRDLLTLRPTDAFSALIYKSAAQSYAWLDPDPQKTLSIFKEMIQSILSGKNEVSAAVGNASAKLRNL